MKKIFFLSFCFAIIQNITAQVPDELKNRLQGKTKLTDIMREVESFYKNNEDADVKKEAGEEEEEFENDYLRWKRWEYYERDRLDENGNIIPNLNIKILREWKKYNQQAHTSTPLSSYSAWSPFGPNNVIRYGKGYNSGYGRINCVGFHPTDPNTLIAGLPQGGIWRTTNNGTGWTPLANNLPSNSIGGLVWDRTNANIIYALTGDGDGNSPGYIVSYGYNVPSQGVFKSTNGGVTWDTTGIFPNVVGNFFGYKLVQHPTNASILFAATSNGIYKTINAGFTWTRVQAGKFTDIEFKPGDATIMYAAQYSSASPFWRSTTSGDSWTNAGFTGVPSNSSRIAIGVSANQPDYIYILAGGATGNGSFVGVYRSTTNGAPAFSLRTNTPNILGYPNNGSDNKDQATYDLNIEVDPSNASTVFTSGINVWKSIDGGASFTYSTQWYDDVPGNYVHADIHSLAYNSVNGYLYSTSDGGVGVTSNSGSTWTFISTGLQALATYNADYYEADGNRFASGAQDNGTDIKYTGTLSYRHIYGADGFDCVIKDDDANTIVMVANSSILKTIDGGLNVADITVPGDSVTFPNLARDYNSSTRIFAGGPDLISRSDVFGGSWVSALGIAGRVLTTCPSNSDRLYAGSGTVLRRSDNATTALTFTTLSNKPGYPVGRNVTGLDVRPSNSLYAYASFGGYVDTQKVYSTTDGGANWTNITGTLPNVACHSIAVDANNTVYVGTDVGVFVRSVSMTDWQPFYNNLPVTPVSDLKINNTLGKIYAATFGRGNYSADLYSTCPPSLSVSGIYTGQYFFEASGDITATATVSGDAGTKMAVKAGDHITLNPGFLGSQNSQVKAYIGPCNTGGVPLKVQSINDPLAGNFYVPAKNGIRYADAKISTILPGRKSGTMEVISAGKYSARLTNVTGDVIKILFTDVAYSPGRSTVNWSDVNLPAGLYYIQLFKENELVHFHEFEIN